MKLGNVITLDANGERIIQAIAQGSWAHLTDREFRSYQRAVHDWNEGEVKPPRSGYHEALSLIRSGKTSAAAISTALGPDGQNGEEGNIWALFDARHRMHRVYDYRRDPDLQAPLNDAGEDDQSQPEEADEASVTAASSGPAMDFDEEDLIRHDLVQPKWSDWPVSATEGALSFIAQVSGRTIRSWVRHGAPVQERYRRGLIFDLVALADWMIKVERDGLRLGTKTMGSLTITDLKGPRRRITMKISRKQEEAARFKAAREERLVECSRLAIEAAAVIEDAAAVVGWAEIEAITGLRHVPSTGRAA
ncbi:hypothetical protein ASF36_22675 [Methylobacterium sp. Leaf90]|nr:hypothetical protein ASF36_22675 [Methylobacterium sp. Leaf90]